MVKQVNIYDSDECMVSQVRDTVNKTLFVEINSPTILKLFEQGPPGIQGPPPTIESILTALSLFWNDLPGPFSSNDEAIDNGLTSGQLYKPSATHEAGFVPTFYFVI